MLVRADRCERERDERDGDSDEIARAKFFSQLHADIHRDDGENREHAEIAPFPTQEIEREGSTEQDMGSDVGLLKERGERQEKKTELF